jgi:histidyl-tRNA synthetase
MTKPGLPQGTRDFSPETVRKRSYILNTIRSVFELFGFQPLETPAMENLDTLMGKYGEEGDKLIFRVLNNGLNDPKNIEKARAAFENTLAGRYDKNLTERALRYDLTIPFARYVAMNFGQLTLPFRRYQVQPVWRADRPQKGRYREFYQCDADVVGSKSLMNEVELALIYHNVFKKLQLDQAEIRINSRKVLYALALQCGGANNLTPITVAIDKLDKIGMEGVRSELSGRGISSDHAALIERYLSVTGSNAERLDQIRAIVGNSEEGEAGVAELRFLLENTAAAEPQIGLKVDFTLARGLNYYTGIIFEAKAPPQVSIGSIGGGGRYDDLTGLFGVPNVPGVGISFGVDRIYDVLEELKLFPADVGVSTRLIFLNNDVASISRTLLLAQQLRHAGISCEIYPEPAKIDKQYKYAEKKNIPFVGTLQNEENSLRIKNISTGEVVTFKFSEMDNIVNFFNN